MNSPFLPGIEVQAVTTDRLPSMHCLLHGDPAGVPVILVHGNVSAARFWEELMLAFPKHYFVIAPDLRNYGRSSRAVVDATRGVRDHSDDLHALVTALGLEKPHFVGWSLGGNVVIQYAIDHPEAVRSLTLVASGSPFGYGGTHGLDGTPNSPDFAGTGGGITNPEFVRRLAEGERGADSPFTPRSIMNTFYFRPPFRAASDREDVFVDEMVLMDTTSNYPGDMVPTENWPGVGPGLHGVNNALSPKYLNQRALADIPSRIPILWIRGDSDQIVSDASMFDLCTLGKLGAVPGWPGEATHPSQPMVGQLRAVLEAFAANGGSYREVVLAECGHSPHIERPREFQTALFAFLEQGL